MDMALQRALVSSIRHWERDALMAIAVKRVVPLMDSDSCALCSLFIEQSCLQCPLVEIGQRCPCYGSVWCSYNIQRHKFNDAKTPDKKEKALKKAEVAARRMIKMLKELFEKAKTEAA